MIDHLLESSHRDDSNKWSNIGFDEEITQVELIEVNHTPLFGALPLQDRWVMFLSVTNCETKKSLV